MENSIKTKALRRLGQLSNERQQFESHWKELSDYILPTSTRFFVTDANKNKRNSKIINGAAMLASRVQTSGMMSGITSPAKKWFRLTTSNQELNENHEVNAWCDTVADIMEEVFSRSNFYQCISTLYQHLGTFATSAMYIGEDSETVIRCETFPVGSYYIAQNHKQVVNAFYRKFMMTTEQLVNQFGVDNVSSSVKQQFESNNFDTQHEVIHFIQVNPDFNENLEDSKHKRFMSAYFEKAGDGDKLLRLSGYDEFPVMVARWEINGESVYGTNCPGMVCLGDVKALQIEERRKAKVTDLITDPPVGVPTSLKNQKVNMIPGGISYYDNATGYQKIEPLISVNPTAITIMQQDIAIYEHKINQAYYVDLFLMMSNSDRRDITATEIMERKEEKLLMLGPVLSRLDNDFLDPAIDRTFNIMLRRNMLPTPPEALEGEEITVEYLSVMAQAQKSAGVQNIERFIGFTSNVAQIKPEALDHLNIDEIVEKYADMVGIDSNLLKGKEQIEQLRNQRQQQQDMQQSMDNGLAITQGIKNMSGIGDPNGG